MTFSFMLIKRNMSSTGNYRDHDRVARLMQRVSAISYFINTTYLDQDNRSSKEPEKKVLFSSISASIARLCHSK